MEAARQVLAEGLSQLEAHIHGLELRDVALARSAPDEPVEFQRYREHILQRSTSELSLEYCAAVVFLYGLWERFVESVLAAYVSALNSVVDEFAHLPQELRAQHTNLSAELLLARHHQKYAGVVEEASLVRNLNSCMRGESDYKLNTLAFAQHSQNLRIDVVTEMFARVGLPALSAQVRQSRPLSGLLEERGHVALASLSDGVAFHEINDLAARRNEVAHGETSSLLSREFMRDYARYVGIVGQTIVGVLRQQLLRVDADQNGIKMPSPIAVYNRSIVCFASVGVDVRVGDRIVGISGRRRYHASEIQSIEVDHERRSMIDKSSSEAFAALVQFPAKLNWEYRLIPAAEDCTQPEEAGGATPIERRV